MPAAFMSLSNKSTNVFTTGTAHSELGFQMSFLPLAAGDAVALVYGEMKCPCATLEERLTDSSLAAQKAVHRALLPPPRQLNGDLHIHPVLLLTQDVFCFPALNDEDVRGPSRDVGDEHVT